MLLQHIQSDPSSHSDLKGGHSIVLAMQLGSRGIIDPAGPLCPLSRIISYAERPPEPRKDGWEPRVADLKIVADTWGPNPKDPWLLATKCWAHHDYCLMILNLCFFIVVGHLFMLVVLCYGLHILFIFLNTTYIYMMEGLCLIFLEHMGMVAWI